MDAVEDARKQAAPIKPNRVRVGDTVAVFIGAGSHQVQQFLQLLLLTRLVFIDCCTRILHRVAKAPRGITKNRITNSVEQSDFVSDAQSPFSALVVQ